MITSHEAVVICVNTQLCNNHKATNSSILCPLTILPHVLSHPAPWVEHTQTHMKTLVNKIPCRYILSFWLSIYPFLCWSILHSIPTGGRDFPEMLLCSCLTSAPREECLLPSFHLCKMPEIKKKKSSAKHLPSNANYWRWIVSLREHSRLKSLQGKNVMCPSLPLASLPASASSFTDHPTCSPRASLCGEAGCSRDARGLWIFSSF